MLRNKNKYSKKFDIDSSKIGIEIWFEWEQFESSLHQDANNSIWNYPKLNSTQLIHYT